MTGEILPIMSQEQINWRGEGRKLNVCNPATFPPSHATVPKEEHALQHITGQHDTAPSSLARGLHLSESVSGSPKAITDLPFASRFMAVV